MRALYFLLLFALSDSSWAQTTYTWNVATGDWTVPSNWTPARITPAANDILVFNGSTIPSACATNIPLQTVGKLRLINNATVRFVPGPKVSATGTITRSGTAVTGTGTLFTTELKVGEVIYTGTTYRGDVVSISSNTSLVTSAAGSVASTAYTYPVGLTVSDGTASALDIQSGCTLNVGDNGAEPMTIYIASGSKGQSFGNIRLLYNRNRIYAIDSASMIFKSGSIVSTDSSYSGNCFGAAGVENSIIFESGSVYQYYAGANPFGLTQPSSKVVFSTGSTFEQLATTSPAISGRMFSNFTFNVPSLTAINASQGNTANIDNLVVLQGHFNFTTTGGNTNIKNVSVSGGTLNFNFISGNINITGDVNVSSPGKINLNGKFTSNIANVNFKGTSQQTISGTGTLRIAMTSDSAVRFRVQNPSGVLLQRALELNAAILDMDSGALNLNSNPLTLGASGIQGRATQLNGYIGGVGSVTRWYTTLASVAGDSSLFPVGTNSLTYPAWVFGTPVSGGTVTLSSFTENHTVSGFTTPFYDTSTSAGVTVNNRLGHAWSLTTGNGLSGSDFNLRLRADVTSGYVTNNALMRVTLSNGIAPGTLSEDGGGTLTQPTAGKTGMTAAQLNNTFYIGTNTGINPLPVTFIKVSAERKGTTNNISWTTARESNLQFFEVERSVDGIIFEPAGKVKATNTAAVSSYNFRDEGSNAVVYRIMAVNFDGSVEYSDKVTIGGVEKSEVVFYPNPVNNHLTLTNTFGGSMKLFDHTGKEVRIVEATGGIDTSGLSRGMYYLHIDVNGTTEVVKFVKQ